MKYLQKKWVRFIVSLLIASIAMEIVQLNSGNPNVNEDSGKHSMLIVIFGIIIYFILSALISNPNKSSLKK